MALKKIDFIIPLQKKTVRTNVSIMKYVFVKHIPLSLSENYI